MKWIFLTLLAANLAYLGYQLTAPAATRVTQPAQLPEGEPIQLLSERAGSSDRTVEVETVLENPIAVDEDPEVRGCEGLGPFENVLAAQDVAERLAAIGAGVEMRAVDRRTGAYDYRVVLPPLTSLQEAFRRLRELKSRGIDSYVITQGEDSQGISLGVFSTESAALRHRDTLLAMGYEPRVKEIPRVVRGYWIFNPDNDYPAPLLAAVAAEFEGVSVQQTACAGEIR